MRRFLLEEAPLKKLIGALLAVAKAMRLCISFFVSAARGNKRDTAECVPYSVSTFARDLRIRERVLNIPSRKASTITL